MLFYDITKKQSKDIDRGSLQECVKNKSQYDMQIVRIKRNI